MNKRNNHSAQTKTKAVLEILREELSLSEIAKKYEVHPNMLSRWKQEFLERAPGVFERGKSEPEKELKEQKEKTGELEKLVGQLTYEVDWLKKKSGELLFKGKPKKGC